MMTPLISLVVLLVVTMETARSEEPRCSKFDYDEKMLEKVIRMEFTFKKIRDDFKTLKSELRAEMASLQSQVKQGLDDMNKDTLTAMNDKLTSHELKIQGLSDDVDKLGLKSVTDISFRATTIADRSPNVNHVIVFASTEINEGQGYNNQSGYFTAPVAGTYLLMTQACIAVKNYMLLDIVVDHQVQTAFQISAQHPYNGCSTVSALVRMNVGSKAWIRGGRTVNSNVFLESNDYTSFFSGVLIHTQD